MASRKNRKQSEYFFDYTLLFIVLFLLGFGLIMVYSTSSYEASISANLKYDEAYYLKHQAFAAVMGFFAMIVVANIPYHFWDERLTTVMAEKQLIAADVSRKKRKKVIDKMAAVAILQGYLQHLALKSKG